MKKELNVNEEHILSLSTTDVFVDVQVDGIDKDILFTMADIFLKKAQNDIKTYSPGYYWKWTSTHFISKRIGRSTSYVRNHLKKLEKEGLVYRSERSSSNWIDWAVSEIKGFAKHENYYDYLVLSPKS